MSLLDEASLVQIPSGYKEDKLYSIIPSDGSGDFNFSRASTATRVNAEGLIETASVVSTTELVTNGDFATDSDWTKSSNTTISGGQATFAALTADEYLLQTNLWPGSTLSGQKVLLTYTVVSNTLNAGDFKVGGVTGASAFNARVLNSTVGTHNILLDVRTTVGNDNAIDFSINATSGYLSIDNVSVKEVITNNVPRIDYTGGGCGSLLLESQRTNLITYSEAFDNAYWIKPQASVIGGQSSPKGDLSAFKLVEDSSNNFHWLLQSSVLSTSGTKTYSIFAKAGERNYISMGNASGAFYSFFDLQNGTVVSSVANAVGSIEEFINGWYRCTVKLTTTGAQAIGVFISTDGTTTNYQGDGTSGIYLWGAQLEQGSYPTSYIISNSGTTTTRIADTSSTTGLSSVINSTEGVFYAEIAALVNDETNRWISISQDSNINANQINIRYAAASNFIQVVSRAANLGQDVVLSYTLSDITAFNKIAVKYKVNDWALWVNGVEVDTETSSTAFTANSLDVLDFNRGNDSNYFYGNVKQLMLFPSALTDEQLADLTGEAHTTFNSLATFYGYTIL